MVLFLTLWGGKCVLCVVFPRGIIDSGEGAGDQRPARVVTKMSSYGQHRFLLSVCLKSSLSRGENYTKEKFSFLLLLFLPVRSKCPGFALPAPTQLKLPDDSALVKCSNWRGDGMGVRLSLSVGGSAPGAPLLILFSPSMFVFSCASTRVYSRFRGQRAIHLLKRRDDF